MATNTIQGVTTGSVAGSSGISSTNTPGAVSQTGGMDQSAFLKLFTTQLQNQNPLEPVKNEAFVAQLAQFSQLEASTKMADSLNTLVKAQQGAQLLTGASLIGKKVTPPTGAAHFVPGTNISGVINVPNGADGVELSVYTTSGNKIFSQSLGRQAPGDVLVTWDGRDGTGAIVPEGDYLIKAQVNTFGTVNTIPIATPVTVTSVVQPSGGELILELSNGMTLPLSQVTNVSN
jgi:flagellar basal-body rod modification protein FlgD